MTDMELTVKKAYPNDTGRGIARIDPDTLLKLQASPGDVVEIIGPTRTVAKIWRADRKDWNSGTIRISGFIRKNASVSIDESVTVQKVEPDEADRITLAPTKGTSLNFGGDAASIVKRQILNRPIDANDLVPVMTSTDQPFMRSPGQAIPLLAVNSDPEGIVIVTETTEVSLREEPVTTAVHEGTTYDDIGGLHEEIERVREMVELPMRYPEVFGKLGIEPPKGVLLQGPPGTGKTLLARALANETAASFFSISGPEIISKFYGESENRLRSVFEDASTEAPAIIFIDELDSIAPKRDTVTGEVERRVVAQLLSSMDGLASRGEVVVIGATNRINGIDEALRRPGRFDREITVGAPDEVEREAILQVHTRAMPLSEEITLSALAEMTHGFVGADIESLCKEAAMVALQRYLPELDPNYDEIPQSLLDRMVVTRPDFEKALQETDPSALRETRAEIPEVSWDDIGGLDHVKQQMKESVEWPLNDPDRFTRLGIHPPEGVLLYGPPGTGKTLTAKAIANESDANFISVRGPQLLSRWVGESEQAIREIFEKAHQVAPTIVFFDELDALAPRRDAAGTTAVTKRVVNQLLTEMDGIHQRAAVTVVGATNRPELVDRALIRSGRFDRHIHLTAPDSEEREAILKIHTDTTPLAPDVSLFELAEITSGYVGSELENIVREAALLALRNESDAVEMEHFQLAIREIHPSVTDDVIEYYNRVETEVFGSTNERPNRHTRRGFH